MYKGISKVLFVDICTLDDGKADTILEAILKTIDELEVNKCNAVGFEIDRAAVMTGCKNGLAVKLQNSGAMYLTQIHCAAHRVSLALSQAAKSITIINDIEITLSQLYHFFYDSPVRASALRLISEINENSEIKLKEPKQIHWLSFYEAVDAILKSYPSVIQTLEHIGEKSNDISSVKAKGLLKKIKTVHFAYVLNVVLDILEPIKKLNNMFQYQNVLVSKIEPMLRSCIDVISDLKLDKGENEFKFHRNFSTEDEVNVYEGIELSKEHSIEDIEVIKLNFIDEVVKNLKYRFPDEALGILSSFNKILNPKSYPSNRNDLKK